MFNIVCVKYGTKYTSSHVNALYKGVQKNTSIDHRFICFTDDSTGVECETLPIPENETGWWGKLALFKKSLYDLTGIILFIDLDMHINNSINEYLTLGNLDDLYVMRDFRWTTEYSSAIMRLKLIDQNVDVKFWPDSWQKDIRFYKKTEKSDCKIVVGYGSANIFDLKWFN